MNALDECSMCFAVLAMMAFFRSTVAVESRRVVFDIQPLCNTKASYGNVLGDYTTTPGSIPCSAHCTNNMPSCKSFTYDEATGRCIIRDSALIDISTCDINVKYGILGLPKCVGTDNVKICSLDLHAVPGQISGHLLANSNGEWGTVCDTYWKSSDKGLINADVVCKSFGYSSGTPVYPLGYSSYYAGLIAMDNVKCKGNEESLLDCPHKTTSSCDHSEDVQVTCTE